MTSPVGWIAIEGMTESEVMDALGFVEARPDDARPKASIGRSSAGWVILFTLDFGFPTPARMALLSANGRAIALSYDDRAMGCVARGYEAGRAVWAIEHDGGAHGPSHMAVAGDPPPQWPPILERLRAEQAAEGGDEAEVDLLFDAPLELAHALCGYRHDRGRARDGDPPLTLLANKSGKGWLGRLLGR